MGVTANGDEVSFWVMEGSGTREVVVHNPVNVLNATVIHTLHGEFYVNYISVKTRRSCTV